MPIIQKTVSEYGFEQGFIEALYDAFLEIDGVNLNPTKQNIDTLFSDTSVAYDFTLEYKGINIKFSRQVSLGSMANGLKIEVLNSNLSVQAWSWGNSLQYSVAGTRTVKFTFIVSNDGIEIVFAHDGVEYFSGNAFYYLFIPITENNVDTYLYKGDITQIIALSDKALYKLNDTTRYKIAQNFKFTVPENGIKMLEFSSLQAVDAIDVINTTADSNWVMDIQGLYSCSTVPVNKKLTIGEDEYFSVGTHTIVKI